MERTGGHRHMQDEMKTYLPHVWFKKQKPDSMIKDPSYSARKAMNLVIRDC